MAVLLLDGRVLVIGGQATPTAEVYDPITGTWTTTGAPAGNFYSAETATVLPNGDVLLVGLEVPAQLYHPSTGSWAATGQMIQSRSYHAATLLTDGRVLVAAGWIGGPVISSAEIYDPRNGTWSPTGSLSQNLEPNAAMVLADGTVLVVQGDTGERYDPVTGQWRIAPEMPSSRGGSAALLLADGTVLIAGGYGSEGVAASTSAYLYDPGVGN
jgi:N-acetylneuraminic acid mutarotase